MKTILIVDDEEMFQTITIHFLKKIKNIKIHTANNGQEAIEWLRNNKADLLITDYNMPEVDGEELVKHCESKKYNIPVIALSGLPANLHRMLKFKTVKQAIRKGDMNFEDDLITSVQIFIS